MTVKKYPKAEVCVIVFAVDDWFSFHEVEKWLDLFRSRAFYEKDKAFYIIVGNKVEVDNEPNRCREIGFYWALTLTE